MKKERQGDQNVHNKVASFAIMEGKMSRHLESHHPPIVWPQVNHHTKFPVIFLVVVLVVFYFLYCFETMVRSADSRYRQPARSRSQRRARYSELRALHLDFCERVDQRMYNEKHGIVVPKPLDELFEDSDSDSDDDDTSSYLDIEDPAERAFMNRFFGKKTVL